MQSKDFFQAVPWEWPLLDSKKMLQAAYFPLMVVPEQMFLVSYFVIMQALELGLFQVAGFAQYLQRLISDLSENYQIAHVHFL